MENQDTGTGQIGESAPQAPSTTDSPNTLQTSNGQQISTTDLEERINKADRWMIRLTAAIVIVGIIQAAIFFFQLYVMRKQLDEMALTGKDTHALAVAAKSQADAAKATADSTKEIAGRALAQATASNDLAKQAKRQADIASQALNSSIESANLDRRPWVGLQLLQCNNCRMESDGSLVIGDLSAVVVNTGKTPATDMTVDYALRTDRASNPIPTYDSLEEQREATVKNIPANLPPEMAADIAKSIELTKRRILPPKEVLAPNAARGITIIAGLKQGRNTRAGMQDRTVIYGLGKITYYDSSRTIQHTTTFCVMNEFGTAFRYCPTGNAMN